ncbi:MAG: hypothetical protein EXS05_12050 [Planctomycetaceae bacterium]|nr:hypothetical protein [Planctomycetaceae bacterium]
MNAALAKRRNSRVASCCFVLCAALLATGYFMLSQPRPPLPAFDQGDRSTSFALRRQAQTLEESEPQQSKAPSPKPRVRQLIYASKNLRNRKGAWEKNWFLDMRSPDERGDEPTTSAEDSRAINDADRQCGEDELTKYVMSPKAQAIERNLGYEN